MPQAGWSNAIDLSNPPYLDTREKRKRRLAAAVDLIPIKQGVAASGERRFWIGYEVWKAAVEYNGYREMSRGAPRVKSIDAELAAVERACNDAARSIDQMSDPTLDLWHRGAVHGLNWQREKEERTLYDRAMGVGLPTHAGFIYPDLNDPEEPEWCYPGGRLVFLAPRLRMTAELAARLRKRLTETMGDDRGGGRNLFQQQHGSPGWHLARLCWSIFYDWGGDPTSADGGPYYRFVAAVHEFATGEEGESLPGLRDRVREAVSICGERMELIKRMPRYFGDKSATVTDADMDKFDALSHALMSGRL